MWNSSMDCREPTTRWRFQGFFIFTPVWGNEHIWLIFPKWGWNHQLDNQCLQFSLQSTRVFHEPESAVIPHLKLTASFFPENRPRPEKGRIIFQPSIFRCYCWWFRNPANQLIWFRYPILYMGFSTIPGGFLAGFLLITRILVSGRVNLASEKEEFSGRRAAASLVDWVRSKVGAQQPDLSSDQFTVVDWLSFGG